jgi:hypothetical protein
MRSSEPLQASGNLVLAGTDLLAPPNQAYERQLTADVMAVDGPSEHTNGRPEIAPARATGPRTEPGRERSSRNAIKHGIFSEAIFLKGESRAEFNSLRTELWEAVRPSGRLEELLADKLASISWRYRRLLLAETGEIRKQFLEWNEMRNKEKDSVAYALLDDDQLTFKLHNPDVLKRCLELLDELREGIETDGFQQRRDSSILDKIYGENSSSRLRDEYSVWLDTAQAPEDERVREGYATPEQCKENVLDAIKDEVRRLKTLHKRQTTSESEDQEADLLRRGVPEIIPLERLLRYEASLERAFDRTLGQLERVQRLRLGQPVAPRLDVTISR